jgi:hypothetical protein
MSKLWVKRRPTKRAADDGESARFTGSFLASSFFCSQTLVHARPLSAANANRWAFEDSFVPGAK